MLGLYATDIYGRVPANAPKASFKVVETDTNALGGFAIHKHVEIRFGKATNAPVAHLHIYLPTHATKPVPLLLHIVFFSNPPCLDGTDTNSAGPMRRFSEGGPITNIFAHGYGYATFRYTDIQPDNSNTYHSGVIGLILKPGQAKPASDEWGAISARARGASRVLDYLKKDRSVDAKHVALIGHSRLGKTVLWAGAQDPRFALIFSSCAGEMGSSPTRRDHGETIDDMAANFPWQFAGNFLKYSGHWNDMPVDAHELIALNAPHPVFISGGTQDQCSDPRGEFLAEAAAGPVSLSHRRAHDHRLRLEIVSRFCRQILATREPYELQQHSMKPRVLCFLVSCTKRIALNQTGNHFDALFFAQFIHGIIMLERSCFVNLKRTYFIIFYLTLFISYSQYV
ncbi:MAG TPA: hypothetical protein VN836_04290 [Verrucomicrobiae bacterium]|nr:hypothetical protein [Verrucomicrobiae bacterium]